MPHVHRHVAAQAQGHALRRSAGPDELEGVRRRKGAAVTLAIAVWLWLYPAMCYHEQPELTKAEQGATALPSGQE